MIQQFGVDAAATSRISRLRLLLVLVAVAGCSTIRDPSPTVAGPSKYHFRESQFVFYSDFPIKENMTIFKELSELRDQIYKELQLPESNTLIQVFLFEDQAKYEGYMRLHHAKLPLRRAFFIKQPHNDAPAELLVFTWWGEKIRQDLRHEITHGILHSVCKDVPMWLDEGLAEFYELPPDNNGFNAEHLDMLRKGPLRPDLAKLEKLSEVNQMGPPEYREAWAWVHFMLRGKPESKTVLLSYLQQLQTQNSPPPLLPKLKEANEVLADALTEHLKRLESSRISRASASEPR